MTTHGELERVEPQAEAERGRPGGRTIAGVISRAAAAERILHAMELLPDARRRGVEPKRVSDELGFVLHARPWSEIFRTKTTLDVTQLVLVDRVFHQIRKFFVHNITFFIMPCL